MIKQSFILQATLI